MEISGKEIASRIYQELQEKTNALREKGITPHLVVILIGDNPSSIAYVNQKKKWAENIGAKVTIEKYADDVSSELIEQRIEALNEDGSVSSILIQIPLPPHLNADKLTALVTPEKDIDGFTPDSPFTPPLASAVLTILDDIMKNAREGNDIISWLQSKKTVLLGKGKAGGMPVHRLLQAKGIEHTVIDSKTENREALLKEADIIITAVGKRNIITKELLKDGVILIGVGMQLDEKKLVGDYDIKEVHEKAAFYTPTPGGVGPVNVACLLKNLIQAAST